MFNAPVLNALWWMVSGKPFARAEVQSNELLTALNKVMRNKRVGTAPCDIWPVLKHIAPELSCYNEIYKPLFEVQDFLKREIKIQRQQSEVENSLISVYCKEIDKDEQPEFFHEESLITICLDLFLAGGESTANTLSFALLYMGLYPAVQAKLHAELDEVCGAGRTVTLSERQRLPYLEAVMSEVMRINTIAPMAAPHHADADIEINGYTIPKESNLFLSLWSVLNDKKHWVDPESFRPERFIDSEGKYVKDPWLLVFGIGKRVCLGEAFAMQVMFLFFSNLMNHFKFSLPPGSEPPSTVPESGFTTSPKMYTVLAHPRTSS